MAQLPQLLDPRTYRPCEWDLKADDRCRAYWGRVFRHHADSLEAAIRESYPDTSRERLAQFRNRYDRTIRRFIEQPEAFERIDILVLDAARTAVLDEFGVPDPFRVQKRRENEIALRLLPELLRDLDSQSPEAQIESLAGALLAGNLFDLGSAAAVEHVRAHEADFERLRATQPRRPWLIDDLDAWQARWLAEPYRHVAFFVDNAGADFCLGCLPLARWMAARGSRVTLVANSHPALNDVTAGQARHLLESAARIDGKLGGFAAGGRLRVIASGGAAPLLDLCALTPACVAALADADLLILHGMGRALESNYRARFACDVLRCAVIKDAAVARWLGGRVLDCVFRLTLATSGSASGA